MPLPKTLNDYSLLTQMGYEVKMRNCKPVKVVKRRMLIKVIKRFAIGLHENFDWYVLVTKYKFSSLYNNQMHVLERKRRKRA